MASAVLGNRIMWKMGKRKESREVRNDDDDDDGVQVGRCRTAEGD